MNEVHAVVTSPNPWWNGNIFRVTGEFPSQRRLTRNFDVSFDLCLNKRSSKQSWGWWLETPSRSSWRHCNEYPLCISILQIAGAALLSVCLFVKYDDDGLANLLTRFPEVSDHVKVDELVSSSIVLLIAAGTFMFLVGFFGCCGAWKEIKAFLVIVSYSPMMN